MLKQDQCNTRREMGVHCQINLYKPPDGAYQPGDTVSGVIEYGVDEATVFNNITVSLKGIGLAVIEEGSGKHRITYTKKEVYVDIDYVDHNEKKTSHEIGMYKRRFDFTLPKNIPSSIKYKGSNGDDDAKCQITYYIRIKFERTGFLQFTKRFKKELTVASGIKPELPTDPIIYGKQKKLLTLSSTDRLVNIKGTVKKSVISPGDKIDLQYEVCNNTHLIIKELKVKLVEVHTVRTSGSKLKISKSIHNTKTTMESLKSGETLNFDIIIDVPSDKTTLGFSSIISRDYFVALKAVLPFPYINVSLLIPVEIGAVIQDHKVSQEPMKLAYEDPPPSYWEVMAEETKDN